MDGNVDRYKTEHECDEHWQLRSMFLLKHRDKFSEDRLLCLAQVFINMEILGCRYPEETMKLVAALSEGIVESFREKRKSKLQRTFVRASDAAESKAKGTKRSYNGGKNLDSNNQTSNYTKKVNFHPASDSPPRTFAAPSPVETDSKLNGQKKKKQHKQNVRGESTVHEASTSTNSLSTSSSQSSPVFGFRRSVESHSPDIKRGDTVPVKLLPSHRIKKTRGIPSKCDNDTLQRRDVSTANLETNNPFGNLILVENSFHESLASTTVMRSLQLSGMSVENLFKCKGMPNGNALCKLTLNGKVLATAVDASKPLAKEKVAEQALLKMKEFCYTIQVKANYVSETTIDKSFKGKSSKYNNDGEALDANNIGNKLMKMMGWAGGGLGKDKQGRETPITASEHVNRSGLGLQNLNIRQSSHKIRQVFERFIANDSGYDLAFSPDFTKEERAVIHSLARRSSLKTKSHGVGDDRHIVVSKIERPHDILRRLKQSGGSTEKYNLIEPKSMM